MLEPHILKPIVRNRNGEKPRKTASTATGNNHVANVAFGAPLIFDKTRDRYLPSLDKTMSALSSAFLSIGRAVGNLETVLIRLVLGLSPLSIPWKRKATIMKRLTFLALLLPALFACEQREQPASTSGGQDRTQSAPSTPSSGSGAGQTSGSSGTESGTSGSGQPSNMPSDSGTSGSGATSGSSTEPGTSGSSGATPGSSTEPSTSGSSTDMSTPGAGSTSGSSTEPSTSGSSPDMSTPGAESTTGSSTEPSTSGSEATSGSSTEPAPPGQEQTSGSSGDYTVAEGDTLSSIAQEHGLNSQDIARWNNIQNPDQIYPGQNLRLSEPGS